jgi:hypothetical protein
VLKPETALLCLIDPPGLRVGLLGPAQHRQGVVLVVLDGLLCGLERGKGERGRASTATADYIRGGYLKEIKYGLRKGALFTNDVDAKVTFGYDERCTAADCSSLTESTAHNWPDVPFDAICSSGESDSECLAVAHRSSPASGSPP